MILEEDDLIRWGRRIGEWVDTPVVLALSGPLGAGKSVLARAVARGAGVEGPLPSPTFNLLFRYPARGGTQVVHMDLYRLRDPEELWELGWEEVGRGDEIVLLEWPERAGGLLAPDRWEIRLSFPEPGAVPEPGSLSREIEVVRWGSPPQLPGFPVTLSEG